MGQNQSFGGGKRDGGDKNEGDKDKKRKYEAPIPSRIGKRKKGGKGPDAASKLPTGTLSLIINPEITLLKKHFTPIIMGLDVVTEAR